VFVFLRPHRFLNGPVEYVVVSGTSMEPQFLSGDLVVVRRASEYHVGDVIAYALASRGGARVIHRIVGGSAATGWTTRGDNRNAPDPWKVPNASILGREWVHLAIYRELSDAVPPQLRLGLLVGVVTLVLVWPRGDDDDEAVEVAAEVAAGEVLVPVIPVRGVSSLVAERPARWFDRADGAVSEAMRLSEKVAAQQVGARERWPAAPPRHRIRAAASLAVRRALDAAALDEYVQQVRTRVNGMERECLAARRAHHEARADALVEARARLVSEDGARSRP
jgi:signal peptidase